MARCHADNVKGKALQETCEKCGQPNVVVAADPRPGSPWVTGWLLTRVVETNGSYVWRHSPECPPKGAR